MTEHLVVLRKDITFPLCRGGNRVSERRNGLQRPWSQQVAKLGLEIRCNSEPQAPLPFYTQNTKVPIYTPNSCP